MCVYVSVCVCVCVCVYVCVSEREREFVCERVCVCVGWKFKCTVRSLFNIFLECSENPRYIQKEERKLISPVSGFVKLYPNVIS